MVSSATYPPSNVQQSHEAAQEGNVTSPPQQQPAMTTVPLDSSSYVSRQPERQPAMQLRGGGCVKDCCAACLCCCALEEICCCEIDEFCC
ncbi:hypothetical protein NBRC10512_005349 [Rhodotorula toruloides]|uniref:RHTO0S01e08460g1_1 n=2 Tax=Rhodotorula toruloides TaxID=5286 RepID=A0A061AE86_RHOTO|nr:uncharacterized protein RHTO_04878 [Rhodotorula toruloides NP11]EMS24698.1 hypothetical protein RHTO_04878 [Rhodotorula toruloides NP11]CDR35846.1 RHTO0S01e08460g1_1 [Rhodotorula toruloides]